MFYLKLYFIDVEVQANVSHENPQKWNVWILNPQEHFPVMLFML